MSEPYTRARKPMHTPKPRLVDLEEKPKPSPRVEYNFPPLSDEETAALFAAYTELTGRRVWRSVAPILIVAARVHGPDIVPLLRELYETGGVEDLLARARAHPPRSASFRAQPALIDIGDKPGPSPAPTPAFAREEPISDAEESLEGVACVEGGPPEYRPQVDSQGLIVGLTYGPANRPAFDATSTKRHDAPPTVHVDGCADQVAHQFEHYKSHGVWLCRRCAPTVAS